jgi:hypothetical protein
MLAGAVLERAVCHPLVRVGSERDLGGLRWYPGLADDLGLAQRQPAACVSLIQECGGCLVAPPVRADIPGTVVAAG